MHLQDLVFAHVDKIVSGKPVAFVPDAFDQVINLFGVVDSLDLFDMEVGLPLRLCDVLPDTFIQRHLLILRDPSQKRQNLGYNLQQRQQIRLRIDNYLIKQLPINHPIHKPKRPQNQPDLRNGVFLLLAEHVDVVDQVPFDVEILVLVELLDCDHEWT